MNKDNERKEPWEQPIYETEYDTSSSRANKRTKKSSNAVFISILVVLLVAIAGILAYMYSISQNRYAKPKKENDIVMKSSTSTAPSSSVTKESNSTVDSSSLEASKAAEAEKQAAAAQKAADEAKAAELAAQQNQQTDQNANNTATDQQNQAGTGGSYVVQAGDNLYRIAVNNGMTTDELKALNGITGNEISVGQELKLK